MTHCKYKTYGHYFSTSCVSVDLTVVCFLGLLGHRLSFWMVFLSLRFWLWILSWFKTWRQSGWGLFWSFFLFWPLNGLEDKFHVTDSWYLNSKYCSNVRTSWVLFYKTVPGSLTVSSSASTFCSSWGWVSSFLKDKSRTVISSDIQRADIQFFFLRQLAEFQNTLQRWCLKY